MTLRQDYEKAKIQFAAVRGNASPGNRDAVEMVTARLDAAVLALMVEAARQGEGGHSDVRHHAIAQALLKSED